MAEPVDSAVSSPGAYGILAGVLGALALPAAFFPHSVGFASPPIWLYILHDCAML